ncbi:MAG: hypothetical protein WCI64_02775 [Chlorobium sp.]
MNTPKLVWLRNTDELVTTRTVSDAIETVKLKMMISSFREISGGKDAVTSPQRMKLFVQSTGYLVVQKASQTSPQATGKPQTTVNSALRD